ncbi:MAG TPA: fused response regulator/phosphatase [Cellvibrio sp.]|nr:fused response regulator/phosphatase [Cellvibrio sp.]
MPAEIIQENISHSILVVDDDLFLNELFCHFLQSKGFLTQGASSLKEAVAFIEQGELTDLILLDYHLGDGTGLNFLARLQQVASDNMPPVIMVSTNEDPVFLEDCFNAGVTDYVIKPVNLSLLALKVSALIRAVAMQRLISLQNSELARFKRDAEREEAVAKFTYEYLLRQNNQVIDGVSLWLKPSSSFSGDIAIAKVSPGGDLYFLLADATGHGLSAAITVMPVVSIFNTMVAKGFAIQPIVIEMNRKLERDTPHDRFVAAIVVHIERGRNEIHVWNGGMPTAYWLVQGGIIQQFKSQHMALGILEDEHFDANVQTWKMTGEGSFLACSDGLLEQENPAGKSFDKSRLLEIMQSNPPQLLEALTAALAKHAETDSYKDDVSVCVITPAFVTANKSLFREKVIQGNIEEEFSEFFWQLRISGKKLASCELPPLCNKFLQYLGVEQSFCQIIFLIVSEMVSNALDHGVLQLDSGIKENPEGFTYYFQEREKRFSTLTNKDAIQLTLRWELNAGKPQLVVIVEDSGNGYDFSKKLAQQDDLLFGRGLRMIKSLSQSVEIFPPGNRIQAVIGIN